MTPSEIARELRMNAKDGIAHKLTREQDGKIVITTGRVQDASAFRSDGYFALDITVKSGAGVGRVFAPTWEMVIGYKLGGLDARRYVEQYRSLLKERVPRNLDKIRKFLARHPKITLLCYCPEGSFCHRHIAAAALERIAKGVGFENVEVIEEWPGSLWKDMKRGLS